MADRAPADFWDELYRSRPAVWSGAPNQALVMHAADLAPGRALDLGCGEGGDALWLAEQGWRVTALDIAPAAIERGAAAAQQAGLSDRIEWFSQDVTDRLRPGPFELVTAMFLQSPLELSRTAVLQDAAALVAPGGTLLVVSHAAPPPWSHGHHHEGDFPSPQATVAALALAEDEWSVMVCDVEQREATGPDGKTATLDDSVVVVRRLDVEGRSAALGAS